MSVFASILAAALASAYVEVPKTDVRSVHFLSPVLSVSRPKNGTSAYVRGPLRVDMAFSSGHVRKPLLRIVCLCEADGELVWSDGLWDRPGTNARIPRSDVANAFRTAGRESACSEPSCISAVMPEVGTEPYAAATYGEKDINRGFFRFDRVSSGVKLLLYRFEVWQNGVCAEAWESARTGLGKYDIPKDWFVRGRYQGKFRYLKSN